MQLGSSTFDAYVRNIRRSAECRQSQQQLVRSLDQGSFQVVHNPYSIGIEQTSAVPPFGRTEKADVCSGK